MANNVIPRLVSQGARQKTLLVSSAALSTSSKGPMLPPPSHFVPEAGFYDRAKTFFEFEKSEDAFSTALLSTSRQGSTSSAYGGLIFSQAMAAAENTVTDVMKPHALHSFFLFNVKTTSPIEYRVRRIRDGRSFCTRHVEAWQDGKVAFMLQASFQTVETHSIVHQDKMPLVPHYSTLASLHEAVPYLIDKVEKGEIEVPEVVKIRLQTYYKRAYDHKKDLFDMRPCDIKRYFAFGSDTTRNFYTWFRCKGNLSNECEKLHRYLLCYNTDTISGCAFIPHYSNNIKPNLVCSLDHNIWLHHHDLRADQWLLFEYTSPVANRSRGMSYGRLWAEDGTLVLTCAQEVLVRTRGEPSHL